MFKPDSSLWASLLLRCAGRPVCGQRGRRLTGSRCQGQKKGPGGVVCPGASQPVGMASPVAASMSPAPTPASP